MKASKQLIELLTQGRTDDAEIAQVLGVCKMTARRIVRGKSIQNETAMKILNAFPSSSAKQLFRRPYQRFNVWKERISPLTTESEQVVAENDSGKATRAAVVTQTEQNSMNTLNQSSPVPTPEREPSSRVGCLFPLCDEDKIQARGLCKRHYVKARDFVRYGKTTWANLEATGKVLPPKKRTVSDAAKWFLGADKPVAGA